MAIAPGSKLPNSKFKIMSGTGPSEITPEELFKGKKAVQFPAGPLHAAPSPRRRREASRNA